MTVLSPPRASRRPHKIRKHGVTRVDSYFWMRNKADPEILPYLKAENAYYVLKIQPMQKTKDKLFREMKSRIKETDATAPAPYGDFNYYTKYKKGLQYAIDCRKPKKGGREQVLLDHNQLARGKKYFHTTGYEVSPDHQLLLFSSDYDGSERYRLRFKDLRTGKILKDSMPNSSGSFAWAADNQTVFYTVLDENLRPYRIFRHVLGEKPSRDELMFEEKDPQHFIGVSKCSSEKYIVITSGGKVTTESWILESDNPQGQFRCFEPRKEGIEYHIDHRGEHFYVHTNWKAKNFQLMTTPETSTVRRSWKTLIGHSDRILRDGTSLFANFLVIEEREKGLPQIRVYDLERNRQHVVAFEDPVYEVSSNGDNFDFDTQKLRLSYSSPVSPPSVLEYDMRTRRFRKLKVKQVKGHQKSRYACERVWVTSHDGAKVPLTLLYRKNLKKNGQAPGYLYGYGSYGYSLPDGFPSYRDVYRLVDRGFVYALAHVRGGSEMGRDWYEDGKFLKKKNTFHDFIACAEYLGRRGWIDRSRLAISGGSAGGMLVGACMNMRPELFKVVVAHVPFVDVLNTMFDKSLPLTPMEYKEWGNPAELRYYRMIKSYSPYDNVAAKAYPNLLVTCGLNDPRVTYWEPAKWVAKLRELGTGANEIIFKTNMGAGHFGASGRFEHLYEMAEEFAYILHKFGFRD